MLFKALRELGPEQISLYALYQLELRSGYLRQATDGRDVGEGHLPVAAQPDLLPKPSREHLRRVLGDDGRLRLIAEADEIIDGRIRLFGGQPVPLRLEPPGSMLHWIEYERGAEKVAPLAADGMPADVKFIWEPARLGWAFILGRAYHLTGDERYPEAFWKLLETFLTANPPYLGWNWVSAQEAGLRILALAFAWQVFASSPHSTSERAARLTWAVAVNAKRIPPTLVYARSQNNNHLLSEAAGLYTAGLLLPAHPMAQRWRQLGWDWFQRGLEAQIAADGAYSQHSANYQRLMLQLALWMGALLQAQGQEYPAESQSRLAAATRWLLRLLDRESGGVPDLGPNDGANILPLSVCPHSDYRPLLQAAGLSFLGERPLGSGAWDETSLWLCQGLSGEKKGSPAPPASAKLEQTPHILHSPAVRSWAFLRVAHFNGRPGHADQLHLDLWWRGLNVAQDPGAYLYNAPPPWDNALMCSEVHNTLTVDGQDQMLRAGRFLYLDWAQAQAVDGEAAQPAAEHPGAWSHLTARHDGYRRLGLVHQRTVTATPAGWLVEDALLPRQPEQPGREPHTATLHWLLPDWPWQVEPAEKERQFPLLVESPLGTIRLHLSVQGEPEISPASAQIQIVRAGERIYGVGVVKPTWGWSSPTYGQKIPALAVRLLASHLAPVYFTSEWIFPVTDLSAFQNPKKSGRQAVE